jgi:hypothetical protein
MAGNRGWEPAVSAFGDNGMVRGRVGGLGVVGNHIENKFGHCEGTDAVHDEAL